MGMEEALDADSCFPWGIREESNSGLMICVGRVPMCLFSISFWLTCLQGSMGVGRWILDSLDCSMIGNSKVLLKM